MCPFRRVSKDREQGTMFPMKGRGNWILNGLIDYSYTLFPIGKFKRSQEQYRKL